MAAMRDRTFLEFVRREAYHSVYVVGPLDGRVAKIGIADDPVKRFGTLQTAHWEDLRIWHHWWLAGRPLSVRIEVAIVARFKDKHLRGEWFAASPDALASAVCEIAAEHGIPLWSEATVCAQAHRVAKQRLDRLRAA